MQTICRHGLNATVLSTTSTRKHQRTALIISLWYIGWTSASSVCPLARWQSRPRPGSRTQPAAAVCRHPSGFATAGAPAPRHKAAYAVRRPRKTPHALGDGMIAIDDFDAEPFQRPVADVSAPHQVEIRPMRRIKPHRVVQIEKTAPSFDECATARSCSGVIQMKFSSCSFRAVAARRAGSPEAGPSPGSSPTVH